MLYHLNNEAYYIHENLENLLFINAILVIVMHVVCCNHDGYRVCHNAIEVKDVSCMYFLVMRSDQKCCLFELSSGLLCTGANNEINSLENHLTCAFVILAQTEDIY